MDAVSKSPTDRDRALIPGGTDEIYYARIVAAYLAAGVFVCTNGRNKKLTKTYVEHIIPARKGRGEITLVFEATRLLGPLELTLLLVLAGIAFACREQAGFALVSSTTTDDALQQLRNTLAQPLPGDEQSILSIGADVITGVTTRAILRKQLAKSRCGANALMINDALEGLEGLGVKETDGQGNKRFSRVLSLCDLPGDEHGMFRYALDWRMTMAIVTGGSMKDGVQFLQLSLQERRRLAGNKVGNEVAQLLHAQLHKLVREGQRRTFHIDDFVELAFGPFRIKELSPEAQRSYAGSTRVQEITQDTLKRRRTAVRAGLVLIDDVCDWIEVVQTGRRGSRVELARPKRVAGQRKTGPTTTAYRKAA